jgi:hypothetical protein
METKKKWIKLSATFAALFAFLVICSPQSSHADGASLLQKISLSKDSSTTFSPIKRNPDGSFSVAVTLCFLGRCPNEGDVCCHAVHPMAGNVYWCCRSGQQCVAFNSCH